MLVSRISSPYPGANHVAPPATKDEREYRTRSPPRRNRRLVRRPILRKIKLVRALRFVLRLWSEVRAACLTLCWPP